MKAGQFLWQYCCPYLPQFSRNGFLVQYARGLQNDVYMQIGLITLIGLAAKNAILIVEYAKMNMEQGMDVVHAAVEAAHVRLRPILMTSFAFILEGCLPLAIATGPERRCACIHG